MTYLEKLRAASAARNSLLCIGLDPDPKIIEGELEGAVEFCRSLIQLLAWSPWLAQSCMRTTLEVAR